MKYQIEKIFVDKKIKDDAFTLEILSRSQGIPVEIIGDMESFKEQISGYDANKGKKNVLITSYSGEQVKLCPGTDKNYICCNYHVVNETTNCPLDCSYCILQAYLNNPLLTIYVNLEDMFGEIEALLEKEPDRIWRVGTGELSDSLALDEMTGLSAKLVERFAGRKNLLFELKTKTVEIANLPRGKAGNFVISWSVNPDSIRKKEEHKTASIRERLAAAAEIIDRGYLAGLHFDPIIVVEDWEKEYLELIDLLEKYLDSTRIAWISMGSLRYPKSLKDIIVTRFPASNIVYGERQPGLDGKERYVRPLRQKVYKAIYDRLMEWDNDLFVYFCMENAPVWKYVMNKEPVDAGEVDFMFAESLYRRFPELALTPPVRDSYYDERD